MTDNLPLQPYQLARLDEVWGSVDVPVLAILWRLDDLLPWDLSPRNDERRPLDARTLKEVIVRGGSAFFNHLVEHLGCDDLVGCGGKGYPIMAERLASHGIPEVFRYVWLWSGNMRVMTRGDGWFTSKQACRESAKGTRPAFEACDGPWGSAPRLCVESISPCHLFRLKRQEEERCPDNELTTPLDYHF